eukprot:Lithocolla_globosa_v1_NODE_2398_length_2023_cov_20.183943.p1 type:complete len:528 gc:universal NODE_2398_length_2023_cov_20.183943:1823-240(-)
MGFLPCCGYREGIPDTRTVLWPGFLSSLAFAMTFPIVPYLLMRLVCEYYSEDYVYSYPGPGEEWDPAGEQWKNCKVEANDDGIIWAGLYQLSIGLPNAFMVGTYAAMSDRFGRRVVFMINSAGLTLGSFLLLVCCFQSLPPWAMLIAAFLQGLSGSFPSYTNVAYAYTSDCSKLGNKTGKFGLFELCMMFGSMLGPAVTGALSETVAGQNASLAGSAIVGLTLFLLSTQIPESVTDETRDQQFRWTKASIGGVIKVLFSDRNLCLLAFMSLCAYISTYGFNTIVVFYATDKFNFDVFPATAFFLSWNTTISCCYLGFFFSIFMKNANNPKGITLPFVNYTIPRHTWPEGAVLKFLICMAMTGYFLYGVVRTPYAFRMLPLLASTGSVIVPLTRSIASKFANKDNQGLVMGVFGTMESLGIVLGPIIMPFTYAFLLPGAEIGDSSADFEVPKILDGYWKGAAFWMISGFLGIGLILVMMVDKAEVLKWYTNAALLVEEEEDLLKKATADGDINNPDQEGRVSIMEQKA